MRYIQENFKPSKNTILPIACPPADANPPQPIAAVPPRSPHDSSATPLLLPLKPTPPQQHRRLRLPQHKTLRLPLRSPKLLPLSPRKPTRSIQLQQLVIGTYPSVPPTSPQNSKPDLSQERGKAIDQQAKVGILHPPNHELPRHPRLPRPQCRSQSRTARIATPAAPSQPCKRSPSSQNQQPTA
jgi:hypothetical protein